MLRTPFAIFVLALLMGMLTVAGCFSSGSPAPQNLPQDKLERIIGAYNYNGSAWIRIEPVGDHTQKDVFEVRGTTSLPPGEKVLVQTWPVSFARPDRYVINNGTTETVIVKSGESGINTISLTIDSAEFRKATYILLMEKTPDIASAATWYNIT